MCMYVQMVYLLDMYYQNTYVSKLFIGIAMYVYM